MLVCILYYYHMCHTYNNFLSSCLHIPCQKEQGEGQPQQRSFSLKSMFRRGPEVPIADRIAVVEQEMHELDQVCKGKKRKLKSVRSLE